MPHSHTHFLVACFCAGLLVVGGAPNAAAQPVIDWVTPPVWMQTQTENTSALPGTSLAGPAWISTGRGGKAVIRLGGEQVEINENSLWEWAGQNDGSTGNAVQGSVRVSNTVLTGPSADVVPSADQSVRLSQNAPWRLVLDAGKDQGAAEGLVNFLRNSGYPVSEVQRIRYFFGSKWQIWVNGFMSNEAAAAMGNNLVALAPGILAATAQRVATEKPTAMAHGDTDAPAASAAPGKTSEAMPEEVVTPLISPNTKAPPARR